MNKICSVIVTYGNRFKFLKQVIDSCLKNNITKIIVVDNNCTEKSRKELISLENKIKGLKVIHLSKNIGSAGGFKTGIEKAIKRSECEYILLLDDDNVISESYIEIMLSNLRFYEAKYGKGRVVLFSNRINLRLEPSNIKLGTFLGFDIGDLPYKIKKAITGKTKSIPDKSELDVAGWGGLFLHRSLVGNCGLPNESLILYHDDFEFTYRIRKKRGRIFFIKDAKILDLCPAGGKGTKLCVLGYFTTEPFRAYYSLRNKAYFDIFCKGDKTFKRKVNKLIYMSILTLLSVLFKKQERLRLIREAIKDGEEGKLGFNKKYPLPN